MILDEAIKHAEEVMVENLEKTKGRKASDPTAIKCGECAEEHRQLAEWLKELKQMRKAIQGIKADIEQYEADCMLHCPDDEVCKDCNIDMFKSIYSIIDKHIIGKGGVLDGTDRT